MRKNRLNILLVEDSKEYRASLSKLLEASGFNVIPAEDGKSALELLDGRKIRIDAIASDLMMPNLDGAKLAEINFNKFHIPFILFTGIGDAETALKMLEFGVQDFLVKPFEEKIFLGVLKNALTRNLVNDKNHRIIKPFEGNVGSMQIKASLKGLREATLWVQKRAEKKFGKENAAIMIGYLYEFLQNAYEHGSLGINEDIKCRLLNEGKYNEELHDREAVCKAKIKVEMSVLANQLAVNITDEGKGFDFAKYLNLTHKDILKRITRPNGRGIFMGKGYFDSVKYENGGASVLLIKSL